MERQLYESLRGASQEDFYEAINNPEHELYDVLWDLFETVVIEPGEVFDSDFGSRNQFRYSIDSTVTMEFFPDSSYFEKRFEPNPYRDGADPAGIHLKFKILPEMSCLFAVSLQVWGRMERLSFKRIWKEHRSLMAELLERACPMVNKKVRVPAMDYARSLGDMLDLYFSVRDSDSFIELAYPFAQFDETDLAQNYMIYMSLIYQCIREMCQKRKSDPESLYQRLVEFFAGRLPRLPHPLPCVELAFMSDT